MLPGSQHAGHNALLAPPSVGSSHAAAVFAAIRRFPHIIWLWFIRAQSRRALATLSDHLLRDIGLTRTDVEREMMKPFWRE